MTGISAANAFNAITSQKNATAKSSDTTSGNPGSVGLSNNENLDTTFLNLLVTELKTQDPTSPMDPTAMVGQMISLNQLDQLIAINQTISTGTTNSTTTGAAAQSNSSAQQNAYAALGGK